jgi:hypothetical protein
LEEDIDMRTLAKVSLDTATANAAIQSGELTKIMASALERIQPEAAYFTVDGGKRTAYLVFDLKTPADMPVLFEPLFIGLNAGIELVPAMNADDLREGLGKLA